MFEGQFRKVWGVFLEEEKVVLEQEKYISYFGVEFWELVFWIQYFIFYFFEVDILEFFEVFLVGKRSDIY